MIKCYDIKGAELEITFKEICGSGVILILETDEDYQELKSMIEKSTYDIYKYFCDKIYSCGCYKFFEDCNKFLKEFSYENIYDILRLCKDKKIVCYTEDDKCYAGVFDKCE